MELTFNKTDDGFETTIGDAPKSYRAYEVEIYELVRSLRQEGLTFGQIEDKLSDLVWEASVALQPEDWAGVSMKNPTKAP